MNFVGSFPGNMLFHFVNHFFDLFFVISIVDKISNVARIHRNTVIPLKLFSKIGKYTENV